MDLNKLLKIVIIIAILLISVSVSYHYVIFLPQRDKEQAELQLRQEEERLLSYKLRFQEECDKKYDDVYKKWEGDMATLSMATLDSLLKTRRTGCKMLASLGSSRSFNIDSIYYCIGDDSYLHYRESYISGCIDWKMEQLGL